MDLVVGTLKLKCKVGFIFLDLYWLMVRMDM